MKESLKREEILRQPFVECFSLLTLSQRASLMLVSEKTFHHVYYERIIKHKRDKRKMVAFCDKMFVP